MAEKDYQINPILSETIIALTVKDAKLCNFKKCLALQAFHKQGFMKGKSPFKDLSQRHEAWADFVGAGITNVLSEKNHEKVTILIANMQRWLKELQEECVEITS